jgi:hypothetical protein
MRPISSRNHRMVRWKVIEVTLNTRRFVNSDNYWILLDTHIRPRVNIQCVIHCCFSFLFNDFCFQRVPHALLQIIELVVKFGLVRERILFASSSVAFQNRNM